jgi:hypothetical protein
MFAAETQFHYPRHIEGKNMATGTSKIVYTLTDEATLLATSAF